VDFGLHWYSAAAAASVERSMMAHWRYRSSRTVGEPIEAFEVDRRCEENSVVGLVLRCSEHFWWGRLSCLQGGSGDFRGGAKGWLKICFLNWMLV